jgi:hypothetical protein
MKMKPLNLLIIGMIGSGLGLAPGTLAGEEKNDAPSEEKKEEKKGDEPKKDDEEDDDVVSSEAETQLSLDPLVSSDGLWNLTPEKIEADYKKAGFKWLTGSSKDRGILRPRWMWIKKERQISSSSSTPRTALSLESKRQGFKLFGGKSEAEEINFDFKDGKLSMLGISIWNKGDSDEINERDFKQRVETVKAAMTERMKARPQDLGRDTRSASKATRTRWETPATVAQLEFSSVKDRETGFQGEFIRLRLAPKSKAGAPVGTVASSNIAKVNQSALVTRVRKEPNGDVFIGGMPMVDQGDKGYCALATTERVMLYYGIQCDQHDMAQAAAASSFGTDPDELQDALHKLQNRFKIRVRDIIHWDIKDYIKFTDVYNREAKKVGAKLCEEGYYWISFRSLDKDALRAARCRAGAYERFRKSVIDFTSRGVPLLWGLELGIYPENGEAARQFGGGHMRLIIGFNQKTEELLFSDSWGAGHEFKRMAARDAFTVTKGLYMIEPQAQ